MPHQQEAIDLKQLQLYPVADSNGALERPILPGGNSAAFMWANGLGSTQTTPSASAQAVPTPMLFSRQVSGDYRRRSCLLSMQTTDGAASLPRFKYST